MHNFIKWGSPSDAVQTSSLSKDLTSGRADLFYNCINSFDNQ